MIPEAGDEKRIKAFIRQCFVRGQWSENKLPTSEPLENLVGKDAVQNLRIGKAEPTYMGRHAHERPNLIPQTKPQTVADPFVVQSNQSEWDPFGNTKVSPPVTAPTPEPAKPTPPPANPFSSFTTAPPQQPTPQQPTNTKPPSNPLPSQQKPLDVHSLFVSTPVATQPYPGPSVTGYVPVTYPYVVNPNLPNGGVVPPTYIHAYAWPHAPVITVPTQPPAVQTGPDAFSGLLAGFGAKPTSPW